MAPTVQDPEPPRPGDIPIVSILLLLAGSSGQQDKALAALRNYFMGFVPAQNVILPTPEAPEPFNRHRRFLQLAPEGQLCKTDGPQAESSIDLRNYNDVVRVLKEGRRRVAFHFLCTVCSIPHSFALRTEAIGCLA